AFDPIDSLCPMDRQEYMLTLVLKVCDIPFKFDDYEQCGAKYKEIINILRQMNYSPFKSEQFNQYLEQLNTLLSNEQ
ncbi:MAG: V-type ATP synthase subunit A, partial [Bacteroidales bacterium]|nr:V-type ATP synthase subunit A [Bacteroidales bacterium]